ncbi:MAG: hypothetical protein A2014_07630 [Spirochaetes bacterium GWF1_49_6]|nr:MAG: hypothetical protein A2014_07630 [Spirochaetes bacterium GWF1_49_6]
MKNIYFRDEKRMFSWFKNLPAARKFRYLSVLNALNLFLIGIVVFLAFRIYQNKNSYYQEEIVPRQKYLLDMKSQMGFGGLIHHYYIYMLTFDINSVDTFGDKQEKLFNIILDYRHLAYITPEEDTALAAIYNTVGIYAQKIGMAIRLKSSGMFNPAEINDFVRIDETPALEGFDIIEKSYHTLEEKASQEIAGLLALFVFIMFAALLLLFLSVFLINYFVFVKPLDLAYDELKKKDNYTNIDLQIAKKIQANILPKDLSKFQNCKFTIRYLPLTFIGGDVYDIIEMRRGVFRVFLADATGHGIQAALLTMLIKSEYEKMKEVISQPDELLEILNNEFIEHYALNFFFSCIIIDIDMNKKILTYASAGHPDQYYIHNKQVTALVPTGKMIGMKKDLTYHFKQYSFHYRDRVLLFTDGLFEEFDKYGALWGEDQIRSLIESNVTLPVHQIIDLIMSSLEVYLNGIQKNDDITLIGILLQKSANTHV